MRGILLFLFSSFLLVSCASVKNVSVDDVRGLRLKGMSGSNLLLEFQVKVNNPTHQNLYLKRAKFDVLRNGYTFAEVQLAEKVKFPKQSSEYQTVQVNMVLKDLLAITQLNLASLDASLGQFTFSGYAKGGNWLFSKRYIFDNIDVSQLQGLRAGDEP